MALIDLARSHVKECLREAFELSQVVVDHDGDLPFRAGTAAYFVSVRPDGQKVRAWSMVVRGIKVNAAVLREINEVNAGLETCRMFAVNDRVIVEGILPVDGLTPETLQELCLEVGVTADQVGQMMAAVHGGQLWFDDDDETCDHCGQ